MKMHEQFPLVPIQRGEGVWLYDFEGNRYLDAISSWWVNLFGHGHPRINAAVRDQLDQLEHVILSGFTHEPVVRLSERLSALTEKKLGHCSYASDGASSIEIALKMSFHYWRNSGRASKTRFLSLRNSYHGETIGALAVGDVALFKDSYAPLLMNVGSVASPDARAAAPGSSAREHALLCAAELERHLEQHHQDIAAFIVEPLIQCAGSMAMYDAAYLSQARRLCDHYGVHLIADEIAVGFGRTGSFFACEQAGITPDFLCLSKGLSGGYLPLSVVMTTDEIYAAFYADEVTRGFLHSHSYTGNALACSAALATLDLFEENDVIARNRNVAGQFARACTPLASHPRVRHFRQCGMVLAFDVDTEDRQFARRFADMAARKELLLRPMGNTVYFMTPYIISKGEIDLLASRTLELLEELS
jgi:adenosylmethionine-8-amino-7-oxononanoate aminotransferase